MKNMRLIFALTAVGFMLLFLTPTLEGCVRRPAMSLTKFFYYKDLNPDLFSNYASKWPVEGLPVDVTYKDFKWHFTTDPKGGVYLNGVPSGDYVFNWTWNGEPCRELKSICCAHKDWVYENFVDAKGRRV